MTRTIQGAAVAVVSLVLITSAWAYEGEKKVEATSEAVCEKARQFTFSWQFVDGCNMQPRGGTSKGAAVTLDKTPHEGWLALQEKGLSKIERDRRAILAMAGPYRTSFDFLETVGYTADFSPDRPYQSWGTEYVYVVENTEHFVSLQHIMVMVFTQEDGSVSDPMVMKHWRQDWAYEPEKMWRFIGDKTFEKQDLEDHDVKGAWVQSVYQVDDAPRYAGIGQWKHYPNFSTWESETTWRPLPRREYTARDDYQVLDGINRHTIVSNGWVHEQENFKVSFSDGDPLNGKPSYLSKELGVNRYELVTDFNWTPGDDYWEKSALFWADVREGWAELIHEHGRVRIEKSIDGMPRFVPLFEYASELQPGAYDEKAGRKMVDEILHQYSTKR